MLTVKERIQSSGIPLDRIAKKSGLSLVRLAALIDGADPNLAELTALSKALKLSPSDFLNKPGDQKRVEFLFRRGLHGGESQTSAAIERLSGHLAGAFQFAAQTQSKIAWLDEFSIADQTYDAAEFAAEKFRALHAKGDLVSPLYSLPRIVSDRLNVLLFIVPEQKVDGASAIVNDRAFIFLAPRTFKPRMLFTLAHELGHLLAGHFSGEEFAFVDEADKVGRITKPTDKSEAFADAFASSLLMPAAGVGIACERLRRATQNAGDLTDVEILYLARIFGVSFEAAARRCEDLQLLPPGGARAMYDYLKENYGGPEKRAEALALPDRADVDFPSVPEEILDAAVAQIQRGDLSVGKASSMLRIAIPELYAHKAGSVH